MKIDKFSERSGRVLKEDGTYINIADAIVTDSSNIASTATHVDSIDSKMTTNNNSLSSIDSKATTINSKLDTLNTDILRTNTILTRTEYFNPTEFGISRDMPVALPTNNMVFNGYSSNITVSNALIKDNTETVIYPASPTLLKVISTNANDVYGGSGAMVLVLQGLDANKDFLVEAVLLNGTTAVSTLGTFSRINRALVYVSGGTSAPTGTIYIGSGNIVAGKPTSIYGVVMPGAGQMRQARMSTPRNYVALLDQGFFSVGKNKEVIFTVSARFGNSPFIPVQEVNIYQQAISVPLNTPQILAESVDFEVYGYSTLGTVDGSCLMIMRLVSTSLLGGF